MERLDEGKLFAGDQHPDPLQPKEGGVAFVHMENRRLEAHGIQGLHPADAENDLLPDPHVMVAAVELVGDVPVIRGVGGKVCVEQEQAGQTDPDLPNLGPHLPPGHIQFHHHGRLPIRPHGLAHRQVVENIVDDVGLLPSVPVDLLGKVTKPVKQTDRDKRQPQITGRFAMVARQDTETPGIDRQGFVEAEFRGEIGHQG